jgi:hypothetical protein
MLDHFVYLVATDIKNFLAAAILLKKPKGVPSIAADCLASPQSLGLSTVCGDRDRMGLPQSKPAAWWNGRHWGLKIPRENANLQ